MDGYFISPHDAEQVTMREGMHRRTLGTTDEAMLCEFTFDEGAIIPQHSHMNDQVGYVVSGKLELTIGTETRLCLPGDSYAIPGGVIHWGKALQPTITIEVFSPPRNDYRTDSH